MTDKEKAELLNLRKRVEAQREEIKRIGVALRDCRNELCLRCGNYKQAYIGACDGCRWRVDP